jgi:hypothetical protein
VARHPLDELKLGLEAVEHTRQRMERLYGSKQIALRDLHTAYEALFLRAVVRFEAFLETLFIQILEGKTSYPAKRVQVKMSASSKSALMEILLQDRKFLTWLPIQDTLKRANLYLKDGRPFEELDPNARNMLSTVTRIRNAIAHSSDHAADEFRDKVIGSRVLRSSEKTPAGFLRSPVTAGTTQFENYVNELGRMAAAIS